MLRHSLKFVRHINKAKHVKINDFSQHLTFQITLFLLALLDMAGVFVQLVNAKVYGKYMSNIFLHICPFFKLSNFKDFLFLRVR